MSAADGNRPDRSGDAQKWDAPKWDAKTYDARHAFVWRFGAELLDLLKPQRGERILDLGCGTSHLTNRIAETGAQVIGLDRSSAMLAEARRAYPRLPLIAADARQFAFAQPFDAVFSNAVLHWILEAGRVAACIAAALRPGGRFVAEFGGQGNIQLIRGALHAALEEIGRPEGKDWNLLYFPSAEEYSALLKAQGFTVQSARLFDRPTDLEEGEQGMRHWLEMFERGTLSRLDARERDAVFTSVEKQLRPHLYRDGHWIADYVRLRVVAVRGPCAGEPVRRAALPALPKERFAHLTGGDPYQGRSARLY